MRIPFELLFNIPFLFRSSNTLSCSPLSQQQQPLVSVPIIFLDVDGVINFSSEHNKEWTDTMTCDLAAHTEPDRIFTITWSKTVVSTINAWVKSQRADVRWLTTWDEDAQLTLSPALGFDHFPLARDPSRSLSKVEAVLTTLKLEPANRPIVWLDDDLHDFDLNTCRDAWIHRPALFVPTDYCSGGLSRANLKDVDTFLDSPVTNNYVEEFEKSHRRNNQQSVSKHHCIALNDDEDEFDEDDDDGMDEDEDDEDD